MNTSPITAKERLERITNAPKKPGRPRMVKITNTPKKRGSRKFFTEDCSDRTLKLLCFKISRILHVVPSSLTYRLAGVAVAYKSMAQVRKNGQLAVKGKRNRTNIHYTILLWDIAQIIQGMGSGNATKALNKINGFNEDRAKIKGKPSTAIVDKHARAVLAALGERNPSSLRRQAANARKVQKIKMI
jgi:hypothetical protein